MVKPFMFRLVDGMLTVWNYDSEANFQGSNAVESATEITALERQ